MTVLQLLGRTFSTGLLLAALIAVPSSAQSFGIGGQVGSPTGLTLKLRGAPSLDMAAGWNLQHRNSFFAQGHVLLSERAFPGTPLNAFMGPGLFIGSQGSDDVQFGLSLNLGLSYYTGPLEIFGQVAPQLSLSPSTDFGIAPAIGLRFYP
ncbi:hypothetical protein BH23BAC4_BH23BAC4_15250 [soil metagenome]